MIQIEIVGSDKVVAWLGSLNERVKAEVTQQMRLDAYDLQTYIVTQKLAGQVLRRRSGNLAAAVGYRVEEQANGVIGIVAVSKETIPYAAIHEYGGTIKHPGGTAYMVTASGSLFIANANPISQSLPRTRAHAIPMPARSYMRSALADRRDIIVQHIEAAVRRGLAK